MFPSENECSGFQAWNPGLEPRVSQDACASTPLLGPHVFLFPSVKYGGSTGTPAVSPRFHAPQGGNYGDYGDYGYGNENGTTVSWPVIDRPGKT